MHPYRDAPPAPPARPERGDDGIVAGVAAVVGAVPVIVTLVEGAAFGAEATLGLALALLGVLGRGRTRP